MSDTPIVRPADRLALIVSTICLVAALPVLPIFMAPYCVGILVIALAASGTVRKSLTPYDVEADSDGLTRILGFLLVVWAPLMFPPLLMIICLVEGEPGPWVRRPPIGFAVLACAGAWLPLVLASLAVAEPSQGRLRLLMALGLLQVGLACLLSPASWMRYLTLLYLATLVLSLRPYQPDASKRLLIGVPSPEPAAPARPLWRLLALAAACVLVLLTPSPSSLQGHGLPLGGSSSRFWGLDLNQRGPVRLPPTVAFEVTARYPDGSPKKNLPRDLLFRNQVLELYEGGRWVFSCSTEDAHQEAGSSIADLGPGSYLLEFRCRKSSVGPVVAEPVRMAAREPHSPISRRGRTSDVTLFLEANGTLRANPFQPMPPPRYRQAMSAGAERRRTPAEKLTSSDYERLQALPAPEIVHFAEGLVTRLVQSHRGLDGKDLEQLAEAAAWGQTVIPTNAERVALAVTRHFVESGEYAFVLDRPRRNHHVDPTLDFLENVKAGHCERFASALALILRAWQIPCRVVAGFSGYEKAENGTLVVRHNRAHAWVEALVPRPGGAEDQLDWLTLDPTPPAPLDTLAVLERASWWADFSDEWSERWESSQDGVVDLPGWQGEDCPSWVPWLLALPVGAVVFVPFAVRAFLRRRRHKKPRLPPLYARLLALLARHGHPGPRKGQTPQEHAEKAAADLGSDVPVRVVAAYYRERYGAEAPTPQEAKQLAEAIDEWGRTLAARRA